ncbi:cysteine--tRNA ligase [Jatrophihabitans sp. DSM 45814]
MIPARLTTPPRPLTLDGHSLTSVGKLRMYVCGITPYDVTHLGHASTYVWADLADRVLTWQGHTVTVARNITDVDDVLYEEARRRGESATMLGAMQRASFEETMAVMRVRTPDHQPTAAQAIGYVIQLAAALLVQDKAYVRGGSVYARTAAAGASAGFDEATALRLAAEYRDAPDDPNKDHPLDIAVWRSTDGDGEVFWPSPWGPGRPGWHAECAAMVLSLYGPSVDLHCGGADLVFPHHACEQALAEGATGVTPFSRAWLRAGTVQIDGAKMSKSTGNLILIDDLLADYSPAAIRLLCLNRPWAQPWSYTREALDEAAALLEQLYSAGSTVGGLGYVAATAVETAIADVLLADLDVPAAVALAIDSGGSIARMLIELLALS